MKIFFQLLIIIGIAILGSAAFVLSGVYNVSARVPHYRGTSWVLDIVKGRSIAHHASGVAEKAIVEHNGNNGIGVIHYHAMCRRCHGAPGIERDEFAQGLYPSPPDLTTGEEQADWTDKELLWIVSNGLKFTGMPAFGNTHTKEEMMAIIDFVDHVPEMDPEAYQTQLSKMRGEDESDHHHEAHSNDSDEMESGHHQ